VSEVRHQKQWSQLTQADGRQRLGHAYILSGEKNIGKRDFAYQFVQTHICRSLQGDFPCNQCEPCRYFLQDAHPDILKVLPDNGTISIDMIRDLEPFLNQKSQSAHKWIVIEDAHQINLSASQAILKILEEPINTTFFLVTHQLLTLLPTIRSRAQIISFQGHAVIDDTVGRGQLLAIGIGDIDPLWLAGQWQKEIAEERLYLVYGLMHDLLKVRLSADDNGVAEVERQTVHRLAETMNLSRLWAAYDSWRFIQAELQKGVRFNPTLMFESMLVQWKQIWGS
jgi:hypothetical protein